MTFKLFKQGIGYKLSIDIVSKTNNKLFEIKQLLFCYFY